MSGGAAIVLSGGGVRASVRPREGGVVDSLVIEGRPALARTPWADAVVPGSTAAASEAAWVARWRGGWQLCFPSTGQTDPDAGTPQGFHGVASQAPWDVVAAAPDQVHLCWKDDLGLRAERTWRLTQDGIEAATSAINTGTVARRVAVAEHLVLGGDVLAPLLAGATLAIDVPARAMLAPLDYDGRPAGSPVPWPGSPEARWQSVDGRTPARVAAIVGRGDGATDPRRVTVWGPHVDASITWSGLPHLLLWEELAASVEAPWGGRVVALGVEPTSTPHGAGTGTDHGVLTLGPGERLDWRAALSVRWVTA